MFSAPDTISRDYTVSRYGSQSLDMVGPVSRYVGVRGGKYIEV